MSSPLLLLFALRAAIGQMAAVAERRLFGLLAAAERNGEIIRDSIAHWPERRAAMRAVAIGLALAAAAGAPHYSIARYELRPKRPIGWHRRRSRLCPCRRFWAWRDCRRWLRAHSRTCRVPSAGSTPRDTPPRRLNTSIPRGRGRKSGCRSRTSGR